MNRVCCCLMFLTFAPMLCADAPSGTPPDADAKATPPELELQLTSVTLHAAGKGWFEYSGTLEGAGRFSVDVGTFEVDEAIRVSRILDPAGRGEIRLAAGPDPIQPAPPTPSTRTLGDLLMSMKGQTIAATMQGGASMDGTLVAIEQRSDLVGETTQDLEYMTVLTATGLRTARVADAVTIRPTDDAFNQRLDAALSTLARTNELPSSQIDFVFADGEKRRVTVGVMRRVPMWKISYRIEDDKLIHRGIVDNTSGTDWSNVDLQLVDGNPVMFAMDMHSVAQARLNRLDRPSKHVAMAPSFGETLKRWGDTESGAASNEVGADDNYDGVIGAESVNADMLMGMAGMGMGGIGGGMGGGGMGGGFGGAMGGGGMGGASPPRRAQREQKEMTADPTAAMNHVLAETLDAPAGSTLSLEFKNVDLPNGETTLLDTVISPIAVDDVSVYRQSYHPTATLLCLEIENNTPSLLPSGPLSVLTGDHQLAILGELVLPALGPHAKRLAGYAIDGGIRVTVQPQNSSSETQSITLDPKLHKIKIESLYQNKTEYEFLNRSDEKRIVILEVPTPDAPFKWVHGNEEGVIYETADQFDWVRFSLGNGETVTQMITHQHTGTDVKEWGAVPMSLLQEWIAEPMRDDQLKSDLKKILELRSRLDETNEMLAALLATRSQLIQEISRVTSQLAQRYNGASLPSELINRYQTRLIELENQREKSEQRMRELSVVRRESMGKLGMNPTLPPELMPLRGFVVDTDLIPANTPDFIKPDPATVPNKSSTPVNPIDPFDRGQADPFGDN